MMIDSRKEPQVVILHILHRNQTWTNWVYAFIPLVINMMLSYTLEIILKNVYPNMSELIWVYKMKEGSINSLK